MQDTPVMTQDEREKIHVEIVQLMAETRKFNPEPGKMTKETFWYPIGIACALLTSVAAITTVGLNLIFKFL